MANFKMTSLNVNGIGNAIKRKVIFNNLRAHKADFYMVQETHSSPGTGFLWTKEWGGQVFFSHGSTGSRGVAIMVDRNTELQVVSTVRDTEGRFIGVDFRSGNRIFTVCSIYAPTQDKPREQRDFWEDRGKWLSLSTPGYGHNPGRRLQLYIGHQIRQE